MINRKLLELALLHKEYNCAAYVMIAWAAEYLEGEMESSKKLFNEFFSGLPNEVLRLMKADNTFDCITRLCTKLLESRGTV